MFTDWCKSRVKVNSSLEDGIEGNRRSVIVMENRLGDQKSVVKR